LAKRRIGEAARLRTGTPSLRRAVARTRAADQSTTEGGFTLIELLIVVAVLPMVVGALAVGILSVFSLQTSVSSRLTDSDDAQLVSLHVTNDVQSAVEITTNSSSTSPAPCLPAGSTQVQLMAVQLGNGTEVTYGTNKSGTDQGYDLWRNVCPSGSTTPTGSTVVAHDLPATVVSSSPGYTPPVNISPCATSSTPPACAPGPAGTYAYENGWVSTLGITGVTFKVTAPESNFTYQVTAVPVATANSAQLAQVSQSSTGCGFAVSTSGTYGSTLCFVDFTPWNTQTAASGVTCPTGALPMSANISNTPFTLDLCLSVSSTGCTPQSSCSGPTSAGAACGVAARNGYDDITAVPLPTYTCPAGGSEAFLGNNGFYTGVSGDPALYTVDEGSQAVVTITNISLLSSNGQAATGWQLVTGDAESTDGSAEWIIWQSNQDLKLLPNSTNSPIGNACGSSGQYAPPNYNSNTAASGNGGLSGIGTTTVECTNPTGSNGVNHTGTPMLEAATPSSLTVTLHGSGLQAMFLGVLLP
jgi:prepilin-type N-terminal cleavage/methylation domain-containing protein